MPKTKKRKNAARWFQPGKTLGWHKGDTQSQRRRTALTSRRGNYLKTAKALNSLANVTRDDETQRKARADAKYFFKLHNQSKKKPKR